MSLRRRITAAAALAVAAVVLVLGAVGYLSTRSRLLGDLQQQLRHRATPFLEARAGHGADHDPHGARSDRGNSDLPAAPPLGGAPGYFQSVLPDGRTSAGDGGRPQLPVDARVLAVARGTAKGFFRSDTVRGTHVEVLTVHDAPDAKAIEVALPLTSIDSVLHGLLVTYVVLAGAGVLAAGLLGALIARSALAPIRRFSEETERVTTALASPHRLEAGGAAELRRLAASFNATLEALERSIAAQRHLIADASHELRTPMAALRSNIQIFLEAQRLPAAERAELQRSILAELDELTQLVADVLELARGADPGGQLDTVELDDVVREAVERARRRAPGIEFALDLEPTVITNAPERVARAVTNVIDNARRWSPPDGRVEVTLRAGALVVRDYGPGFAEADLPHVFDRFYRADAARRMPGSGLGLAIARQAAEAHGGEASAANAPDGGAIVRLTFGGAAAGTAPA